MYMLVLKAMALVTVEQVLQVVAALVGVPALLALLIDVLKWAGLLPDGVAPKVSAGLNLLVLVVAAVILQFYPQVDVGGVDAALMEIVKFAALIFSYVIQIVETKSFHLFFTKVLKIEPFSHTER